MANDPVLRLTPSCHVTATGQSRAQGSTHASAGDLTSSTSENDQSVVYQAKEGRCLAVSCSFFFDPPVAFRRDSTNPSWAIPRHLHRSPLVFTSDLHRVVVAVAAFYFDCWNYYIWKAPRVTRVEYAAWFVWRRSRCVTDTYDSSFLLTVPSINFERPARRLYFTIDVSAHPVHVFCGTFFVQKRG